MFWAEWKAAVAMGTAANTDWGKAAAHSSACIPPMDPPTTANKRLMPRWSTRRFWARTMSPTVTVGNSMPQGVPSGRGERGPVEPMQPPSTLAHSTKKRSVSMGRPGPTTCVHQPGLPVKGWVSATYWSPVRAWHTSTALERVAFSVP